MGGTDSDGEQTQSRNQNNGRDVQAKIGILIADFILSMMWIWTGEIIKMVVNQLLGSGHDEIAEGVTYGLKVMSMFIFAGLGSISNGGAHNPLSVLIGAMSVDFNHLFFTVGARIPAEVFGSILGVKLVMATFSRVGHGPKLNVAIHHGALTEGILAFILAIVSMGLTRTLSGSFYRRNWISIISKLALQILASDLTGACINPAAAIGWAYAHGEHISKEHLLVYWIAPVEATVLGVWIFKLLFQTGQDKKVEKKTKSE